MSKNRDILVKAISVEAETFRLFFPKKLHFQKHLMKYSHQKLTASFHFYQKTWIISTVNHFINAFSADIYWWYTYGTDHIFYLFIYTVFCSDLFQ